MSYLITELWIYLSLFMLLGLVTGWFLRGSCKRKLSALTEDWEQRYAFLENERDRFASEIKNKKGSSDEQKLLMSRLAAMEKGANLASQVIKENKGKLDEAEQGIAEFREQLQQRNLEIKQLKSNVEATQKTLLSSERNQDDGDTNEQLAEQIENKTRALKKEQDDKNKKLEQFESDLVHSKSEEKFHLEAIETLKKQLSDYENEKKGDSGATQQLKAALTLQQTENEKLGQEQQSALIQLESTEKQAALTQDKLEDKRRKLKALEEVNDQLNQSLAAKEKSFNALQETLKQVIEKTEDHSVQITTLQALLLAHEKGGETLFSKEEELTQTLTTLEAERDALSLDAKAYKKLSNEHQQLLSKQEATDKLSKRLSRKEEELEQLKDTVKNSPSETTLTTLKKEADALKLKLEECEKSTDNHHYLSNQIEVDEKTIELNNALRSSQENLKKVEQTNNALTQSLDLKDKALNELQEQVDQSTTTLATYSEQTEIMKALLDAHDVAQHEQSEKEKNLRSTLVSTQQQTIENEKNQSDLHSEIEGKNKALKEKEEVLKTLKQQLDQQRADIVETRQLIEECREYNEDITHQRDRLEQQLITLKTALDDQEAGFSEKSSKIKKENRLITTHLNKSEAKREEIILELAACNDISKQLKKKSKECKKKLQALEAQLKPQQTLKDYLQNSLFHKQVNDKKDKKSTKEGQPSEEQAEQKKDKDNAK